jgi:hypothetical protein
LFPCHKCGKHFKKILEDFPIKNNSREELVNYFCDIHNNVNQRLNKPIFDCKKAFDFWGGNCGCSEDKDNGNSPTANNTNYNSNNTYSYNDNSTDKMIKGENTNRKNNKCNAK